MTNMPFPQSTNKTRSWPSRSVLLSALVGMTMFAAAIGYSRSQPLECAQPDPTGCPLELDQPVAALLNGELRVHRWRFQVPEAPNGNVSFFVTLPAPPADYDLYVAREDGTLVGRSIQEGPSDEFVAMRDVPPGAYVAIVVSPRCENSNLPYVLVASARQAPALAPMLEPPNAPALPSDVTALLSNGLGRCAAGPANSGATVNPYGSSPGVVDPYTQP